MEFKRVKTAIRNGSISLGAVILFSNPAYAGSQFEWYVQNFAIPALVILMILLIFFLIFREVACWYWKINQGIALLTEIRDSLKQKPEKIPSPINAGE